MESVRCTAVTAGLFLERPAFLAYIFFRFVNYCILRCQADQLSVNVVRAPPTFIGAPLILPDSELCRHFARGWISLSTRRRGPLKKCRCFARPLPCLPTWLIHASKSHVGITLLPTQV